MDGHSNNTTVTVPESFSMVYLDGAMVRVPVPEDSASLIPLAGGGFKFPAHDGHRAMIKTAKQMDHYQRVRHNARGMPEVAARLGGEDALVDLMYGDVDEACSVFRVPPIALTTTGPYANYYVPRSCSYTGEDAAVRSSAAR